MKIKEILTDESKIEKSGIVILFLEVLLFLVGNVAGILTLCEAIPSTLGLWVLLLVAVVTLLILLLVRIYNVIWKKF